MTGIQIGGIALGAALGALARAWILQAFPAMQTAMLLSVNAAGCLLAGAALAWSLDRAGAGYTFAVIGVLGGFTTYSGLLVQALDRFAAGSLYSALGLVLVHALVCTLAAFAGYTLLRLWRAA